jgi:adenylate kinase
MYANIEAIRSFLALSLIDKIVHENEIDFILDIAEDEFELSKDNVIKEKEILEKLSKNELQKIFDDFVKKVPEREKNYFFDLYSRLSIVDTYLHESEIKLLSDLEKKWNVLQAN